MLLIDVSTSEFTYDFEIDNSRECKDIKVLNYKHMGPIKFPIAQ